MRSYIYTLTIFFSTLRLLVSGQDKIDMLFIAPPPYPIVWDEYLTNFNNAQIHLLNKSLTETYSFGVYATLSGPYGIFGESDMPTCNQEMTPLDFRLFSKDTWGDLCLNFDISNLNYGTLSESSKTDLLIRHILPEGDYELCMILKESSDLAVLSRKCFRFTITHPDIPQLILPVDNSIVPGQMPVLNVMWIHLMNDPVKAVTTKYSLKIIDLGEEGGEGFNPLATTSGMYEAMDDPSIEPTYYESDLPALAPVLIPIPELSLISNHRYAVRVVAENDEYPIPIGKSRSNIVSFKYDADAELECGQAVALNPVYPKKGDFVPFQKFPMVIQYDPYCDKYREFEYTTNVNKSSNGDLIYTYTRPQSIKWNSGPRKVFEYLTGISDPDNFYSSHLILGDVNNLPDFDRGSDLKWSASGKMKYELSGTTASKILNSQFVGSGFKVGMSPPKQLSPINGDKNDPGVITLSGSHSHIPESPLPPFNVFQINKKDVQNYEPLIVNELAVVQVSKREDFDTIIRVAFKKINVQDDQFLENEGRGYRVQDFKNAVYGALEFPVNLEDSTMYYWRIGWCKDPSVATDSTSLTQLSLSDFYSFSIDSFRIGDPDTTKKEEVVPTPKDTFNCGNDCEIGPIANVSVITKPVSVNDTIRVGQFEMIVTEVTKVGETYKGEGRIEIPFLKRVTVKVVFEGIKINTDKRVFDGMVRGKPGGNELESLTNFVLNQPMELPIGWDTTISDTKVVLAIMDMEFGPRNAEMAIEFNWDELLPASWESDIWPSLGTRVCFHPGGFTNSVLLYFSEDVVFDANNAGYGFAFKGGHAEADTANMCYVRWGCFGFEGFQIAGEVRFDEDFLVKDSGLPSNDKPLDGRVKAGFAFRYHPDSTDYGIILRATMDPFQFKDLEGWGFTCDTVYIDMSDAQNPVNFTVPKGYTYPGMAEPSTAALWNGVYIPKLRVMSPKEWGYKDVRTTVGDAKMIFGAGKYYTSLTAVNVVSSDGVIGRLGATIDTIEGVLSTDLKHLRMNGKVLMPFVDEGSHLLYSGLYAGNSEWNFMIKPQKDSLDMSWSWGKAVINENSILSLVKASDTTKLKFKFMLNGYLSLNDAFKPGDHLSSLSKLDFKSLRFENWGYESGYGFTGGARFSLTSPAKTMNGFPVQLDSIDFTTIDGNPGLYFRTSLTLMGETNGFSAFAGLIISAEMDFGGDKDLLKNPSLSLSDVGLDVATSGFELKGYLKFINEGANQGIEGVISAKLPGGIGTNLKAKFGTVITNPLAPYNSAQNYSYWYVDALVTFGTTGIPIFSGINMYGIGGGLWYHMKQDTTTMVAYTKLVSSVNSQNSPNLNYSGIPYSPSFETKLGLKVQGLFGSTNEGKTFNMLLALQAEFSSHGGPIVSLRGDANFMSNIQDRGPDNKVTETKKAIWASVVFTYNGQEHFVDARFDLYTRFSINNVDMLYGMLPGYKVVEARFFAKTAGENYWYFKMGEPDERSGLKFDIKLKKVIVQSYLQMGQGLPAIIPEPDGAFMAMLQNSSDQYQGPACESILNKPLSLSAEGVAFGLVLKDTFRFEFSPFYFSVSAILGFDINITQSDERTCAENNQVPGINNWYATGQLYAGLHGAFGIHVDVLIIEGDFNILTGSIATLMKGGLPNPSWFNCRGRLAYEVLGIIDGSHTFEFSIGEKCTIGNGNPFSESPLIQDLVPIDQSQDVSIFTIPTAAFSMPMNTNIEFWDDKLEKIRKFRPILEQLTLNPAGGQTYQANQQHSEDRFMISLITTESMKSLSWHDLKVSVVGQEEVNGQWINIRDKDGNIWRESKFHRFRTGIRPDSIDERELEFTYPLAGQNYFLKGESAGSKGIIQLNAEAPELLYTFKTDVNGIGRRYAYEMQFIKVSGGDVVKVPAQISAFRTISFDVSVLDNQTKYIGKLFRKFVFDPRDNVFNASVLNASNSTASSPTVNTTTYATISNLTNSTENFDYNLIPAKFVKLTSVNPSPTEIELYKFIFRTSKFNILPEKIEGVTWPSSISSSMIQNLSFSSSELPEPFESYDFNGWTRKAKGYSVLEPGLVQLGVNIHNPYGDDVYVSPMNGLPQDPIYLSVKDYYYKLVNDIIQYKYSFQRYSMVTYKLRTVLFAGKLPYIHGKPSLVKPINLNQMTSNIHQTVGGLNGMFAVANNMSMYEPTNNAPTVDLTPRLRFDLDYGRELFTDDILNKFEIANIMYSNFNSTKTWGDIIRTDNVGLYNRMSYAITVPAKGTIPACFDSFFGMVYLYPSAASGYDTGSQLQVAYRVPGTCPIVVSKGVLLTGGIKTPGKK